MWIIFILIHKFLIVKKGANLDEYYFDFSKLSYFLANSYIVDILDK